MLRGIKIDGFEIKISFDTKGYIVPQYVAVEKLKLTRKLKMLHAGNMQIETITINNSSIWSL